MTEKEAERETEKRESREGKKTEEEGERGKEGKGEREMEEEKEKGAETKQEGRKGEKWGKEEIKRFKGHQPILMYNLILDPDSNKQTIKNNYETIGET